MPWLELVFEVTQRKPKLRLYRVPERDGGLINVRVRALRLQWTERAA